MKSIATIVVVAVLSLLQTTIAAPVDAPNVNKRIQGLDGNYNDLTKRVPNSSAWEAYKDDKDPEDLTKRVPNSSAWEAYKDDKDSEDLTKRVPSFGGWVLYKDDKDSED